MKLQQLIEQYVAYRQTLGKRFKSAATILRAFGRTIGADADVAEVGAEQVNAFLRGKGPLTSFWHAKYTALHSLYRYAISRGYATVSPLPSTVPKRPPSLVPYIYSRQELQRLLRAAEEDRDIRRRAEPRTVRTVLLLLYGAGLRGSEVLNLDRGDFDADASLITIRESKFFKSRLVPLGPRLAQVLNGYAAWRQASHPTRDPRDSFFVGRDGQRLSHKGLAVAFRQACVRAGIRRQDAGRYQPRMHDLRHTFAVHRLTEWYRQGADVQKMLPQLSVYLGHCCLSSTQLYLTMTPELLQQASDRFERYACQEDDHG
jgi:site-specific recombinase XerD